MKVVGGGCSGLTYKMDLDVSRATATRSSSTTGAKLVVDRKSFLYLNGTELDYNDELMSSGFNLQNPNVKRTLRLWLVVRRVSDAMRRDELDDRRRTHERECWHCGSAGAGCGSSARRCERGPAAPTRRRPASRVLGLPRRLARRRRPTSSGAITRRRAPCIPTATRRRARASAS